MIPDERFNPGHGVVCGVRVPVDRDEEVCSGGVCLHGLLIRGFIDVGSAGVLHVDPAVLKNLPYGESEGESIVLFLTAVVDGAGIAASVSRVEHD